MKKGLVTICTKDPTEILLENIESIKFFYPEFDILVVDSNSTKNLYIFEKLPKDIIFMTGHENYELGAWTMALRNYGDNYKQYMFLQDVVIPISRIKGFDSNQQDIFYSFHFRQKLNDMGSGCFERLKNVYQETELHFMTEFNPDNDYKEISDFVFSTHSCFISGRDISKKIVFSLEAPYENKGLKKNQS
jgi:hypothetical protein